MKSTPLTKLVKTLSAFDPADLLATVSGLQLMPENADRTIRLEALSHAVASISSKGFEARGSINLKQLEKICNSELSYLEAFVKMEDPFNNPFTETFTFHGGSYIVFPGIAEEPTFVLRHMANALFLNTEPFPDHPFKKKAHDLILAVLALSNEIARRAGLKRGEEPVATPDGNVVVPSFQRLEQLKISLSFSRPQLANLLAIYGVSSSALEQLTVPLGKVSIENYQIDNGELLVRPIVQVSNRFIVAIPGMLLTAARNELVRLVLEHGVKDEFVKRYNVAIWRTVVESLNYIENQLTSVSPPNPPDIPCFQDAFFGFDTDKVAYVALVTDSLAEYDYQEPLGRWPLDDIGVKLEARVQEIYEYVFTNLPGVNEVLILLVLQGLGRLQMIGFRKLPEVEPLLLLGLTAGDLETIMLLEAGDQLALWKYTLVSWRLKQQAKVLSMGELNEYYLYRKNGHSFYFSDESRPNFIVADVGGSGELRREALCQRDWHAVPSFQPSYLTEVTSLFSTRNIPIYIPKSILSRVRQKPALLVEGLPLLVWIIGSEQEDESQHKLRGLYARVAEAIGYWIWQFSPSLSPLMQSLVSAHNMIIIRLFIPQNEAWHQIKKTEEIPDEVLVDINADTAGGILDITISSYVSLLLQSSDNSGERQLMQQILGGLRYLLPDGEHENLSDSVIATIIDCHAPLGLKKKLFFLDSAINPDLDKSGLSPYRKVQEADEDELLDELGNYLSLVEKLQEGSILDNQRTAVLQKAVGFLYCELKKLVASLNSEDLLEYLIAYHEAIVQEVAEHRLTIPTRLACFSSEPEMVDKLCKEMPDRYKAALASRFVIEYVVSRPPAGIRPFSLSVYDRLQALASQVVTFGFESDLIHFLLADVKLAMLPSGRLGRDRKQYEKARNTYLSVFSGGEIVRATREFRGYWRSAKVSPEKPDLATRMDAAASIEFGYSITELQELFGEAINIGRKVHPSVASLPLKDLIGRLANQLGWTLERVGQAIEMLSLKPRSDFLKPTPPYQPADVYPWKFNRPLSYLRRPFLLRERDGELEVIWGIRHLYKASEYLIYLCLNGRLKAQSIEMKQVMSDLRNEEGEEFNDQVADLLEQDPKLIVRRRVKKIGKLEIKGEKGVLGDIDVLVADPERLRLRVIECKNFELARAPHEMANELAELFKGRGKEKSAVEKHQERVDWISQHLQEVMTWLGLDPNADWKVESLIVTDYELATPHLWSSPIPVVSLVELSQTLSQ